MGITGVGSSYNFVYNTKTGKLSTKDGSKNEFVDFCNGDVKGEDTETLNHFDEHTRYQFTRMLFAYGTGMTGQNPFANDEKVEITADIDSATHTSFYVNGQKAFTAITGMSYLPSEIQTFGTVQQPFKTRGYKPVYGEIDVIKSERKSTIQTEPAARSRNIVETQGFCYNGGEHLTIEKEAGAYVHQLSAAMGHPKGARHEERGLAACRRSDYKYDRQHGQGRAYQHENAAAYLRDAGL